MENHRAGRTAQEHQQGKHASVQGAHTDTDVRGTERPRKAEVPLPDYSNGLGCRESLTPPEHPELPCKVSNILADNRHLKSREKLAQERQLSLFPALA